jgi:phospholipid/cholesterol/gamma-HCH transport system permease protein
MHQMTGRMGRQATGAVNHVLNLIAMTCRIGGSMFRKSAPGRALVRKVIIEQVYFTAIQALPILIPIALITGSALIVQFSRVSLQIDLGKMMVILVVRELGPVLTALLIILRSATSVTIEISYMNVLNEMETMEMEGIDPLRYVGLPRLIGITSAIFSLFVLFDLFSIIGGYAIVWTLTDIPVGNFIIQIGKAITAADILVGAIKAISFGVTITVTCLYHGFAIQTGFTGIPSATGRAAMECFFFCMLINGLISTIFYI